MTGRLAGATLLMSGGSRGIGLAIAVAAAREGANIALVAKTVVPDPRIPGTIGAAAAAIEEAGGRALPIAGDVRNQATVEDAVQQCVAAFGGIDIVVNNASAINLGRFGDVAPMRFDLMLDVNVRGTFALTSAALPYLHESPRAQVMTLSPPLNLNRYWLGAHAPYTMSKYAMSLLTLGLAEQERGRIAAYCLWPQTLIATAAVRNVVGGDAGVQRSRTPQIMADAAVVLFTSDAAMTTGTCHIDAEVLRTTGRTDLSSYATSGSEENLQLDLFLDAW
ncbi:SDR family oxidoreductase [Agromyces sp. SYSU T00266]|uniref:SDR family oxidoreductase n=1 Tax=Agromyces zhanjiangensis TaxID=3158562 RepID=UPI003397C502